jgi:hypothetical protein
MSFEKAPYEYIHNGASISRVSTGMISPLAINERRFPQNHYHRVQLTCPPITNTLFLGYRILFACKPKNPV